LEALLAAKREADEIKRRHTAELGFLKTELDQTLFQVCVRLSDHWF
jgi:hypothetical protein